MNFPYPTGGTVVVIDDDAGIREALGNLFRSVGLTPHLYSSGIEFLTFLAPGVAQFARPACFVIDVRLPGRSGLELLADLHDHGIASPVIFMTGHADVEMSVAAMKAGAVDFFTKPFRPQDLLDSIQAAIVRDRAAFAGEQQVALLRSKLSELTIRERAIMDGVVAGRPNRGIAADMGVSEITIKVHRGRIMRKMQARSLAELVKMAGRLGLG